VHHHWAHVATRSTAAHHTATRSLDSRRPGRAHDAQRRGGDPRPERQRRRDLPEQQQRDSATTGSASFAITFQIPVTRSSGERRRTETHERPSHS